MFQKIPILGDAELQIGDKFSFPHWVESDGYYQVTEITDSHIYFRHNKTGQRYDWTRRYGGSFFSDYRPYKVLDFVPYDPNQMVSDEDDL